MSVYSINKNFRAVPPPRPGAEPASAAGEADGPTERALGVAEMFGLGLDESYEVALYAGLVVDVRPGDVVFVTGPSGSGKSVLLRCLVEAMRAAEPAARIVDLADPGAPGPPAGVPVIEGLPAEFEEALRLAGTAGLADAFVLLRPPEELSDGQRWRLRLAHALARLEAMRNADCGVRNERPNNENGAVRERHPPPEPMRVLVADEFASTLDRLCARAVAYRLRRLADREGVTVLAASAHDDLVEDLAPDVLVVKGAGAEVEVRYADASRLEPQALPAVTQPRRRKRARADKREVR
jgi:ABC-type ATPase with predicted acetyltransferase domain